ncbi:MAG: hypothetical protein ACRDQC_04530 [Gaiellales bacterium]
MSRPRQPARVGFRIGDVFDPRDPVARFLTGAAMSTNDLIRIQRYVVAGRSDDDGVLLFLLRLNAAFVWETALFVKESRAIPAVDAFINGLPEGARRHLARAMDGVLNPGQTDFGRDLAFIRNHVLHYPELDEARPDRIARALEAVADKDGAISGVIVEEFRFDFADTVAERLISRTGRFVLEELAGTVAEFPARTGAFRDFVDLAFRAYLDDPERRKAIRVTDAR